MKDKWGIPALRFHWKWDGQERNSARHAEKSLHEMASAIGATNTSINWSSVGNPTVTSGHEGGTAVMGGQAKDSVVNPQGHCWDVRNLYITDGSVLAHHSAKGPTETILALAWRASDHLADSLARKDI